jgi:hypothetical protein
MKRIVSAVAVVASLFLLASGAAAQDAASPTDTEVTNRLSFIQGALDGGKKAADFWWYGWFGGYSAATVGQLAVYSGSDNEKQRQDMLVGSVTTALGAAGVVVFPLEAGRFASRLRTIPAATPEERRSKLASAESFLRQAAAQESFGRSWKAQALATAVNLAAGLTIWLHYNRPAQDGLVTFAIGQLISEAQIFSQPMKAVRDLQEYDRRTDFDRVGSVPDTRHTWYVSVYPAGIIVGCRF